MANYLNEMGAMKCVNERGKSVACPTPKNFGCGSGGCGMGMIMPFDLPVIGKEVGFNISDAVLGAALGKISTGVMYPLIEFAAKDGMKWSDRVKVGVGVLSFLGLASERLRESSAYLGFSFSTWPEAAEPLTRYAAHGILKGLEMVTGKQIMAPAPTNGAAVTGKRAMGAIAPNRRIGAAGNTYEVRPNLFRPSQLIATGTRIGKSPGGMGASKFRKPVMQKIGA